MRACWPSTVAGAHSQARLNPDTSATSSARDSCEFVSRIEHASHPSAHNALADDREMWDLTTASSRAACGPGACTHMVPPAAADATLTDVKRRSCFILGNSSSSGLTCSRRATHRAATTAFTPLAGTCMHLHAAQPAAAPEQPPGFPLD